MENEQIPQYTDLDVKTIPNEIDAIIIGIETKTAFEVYGDKARNPAKRIFAVSVEADQHGVETTKHIPMHPPKEVPDNSQLGKFLKTYGEFRVGMQIKLEKSENGFWNIYTKPTNK